MLYKTVLIDFENIIKPNIKKLKNFINKISGIPKTKKDIGLIIIIPEDIFNNLKSKNRGMEKILFLNSKQLTDNIKDFSYFVYDKKEKKCELIYKRKKNLEKILKSILLGIPNDVIIFSGFEIKNVENMKDNIKPYIKNGFDNSFICKLSPLDIVNNEYKLYLSKENIPFVSDKQEQDTVNDLKHTLKNFSDDWDEHCEMRIKIKKDSVAYLKQLAETGSTINKNGRITQKELAGLYEICGISKDFIYSLRVNKDTITSGDEEGVDVVSGRYNFHTHPVEAYERNKVSVAWPSVQDYIGFLASVHDYNTILHSVISLEGIYIISVGNYWDDKEDIETDNIDFIKKNYKFPRDENITAEDYEKKVNKIYYRGKKLFNILFLNWEEAGNIFSIKYFKNGVNCFPKEKTFDIYEKYL